MTAFSAGVTTGGDFTMWGSLAILAALGLIAAMSSRWFREERQEA